MQTTSWSALPMLVVVVVWLVSMAVLPARAFSLWSEHAPTDTTPVGAVVTTCSGCRLNQLHDLRVFIKEELTNHYHCVDVQYVISQDPILRIYNKHQQTLQSVEMTTLQVPALRALLASHGLTPNTPAPVYEDMQFPQVGECLAWRQTAHCLPDGPRERARDLPCDSAVAAGKSGFCACTGDTTVSFDCEHQGFRCADECEKKIGSTQDL
jgi:hypothetical protein